MNLNLKAHDRVPACPFEKADPPIGPDHASPVSVLQNADPYPEVDLVLSPLPGAGVPDQG